MFHPSVDKVLQAFCVSAGVSLDIQVLTFHFVFCIILCLLRTVVLRWVLFCLQTHWPLREPCPKGAPYSCLFVTINKNEKEVKERWMLFLMTAPWGNMGWVGIPVGRRVLGKHFILDKGEQQQLPVSDCLMWCCMNCDRCLETQQPEKWRRIIYRPAVLLRKEPWGPSPDINAGGRHTLSNFWGLSSKAFGCILYYG